MENESTEATAPPATPRPVAPREAAIVNARRVTFEWRPVDAATTYRLEVARDASFSTIVFEEEVPADTNVLTVADFFPVDEQTYFWRVLAKDEDTWSRGERIESFVSATPDEAARHQMNRPDEDEAYGPATMLVRSASKMVSDQLSSQGNRFEKEREMGVAYEGIPTGQILAVAVSILFAVGIIVIILFQWTNITEAAIRQASSGQSMNADLRETQLQANQLLTGYEVIDEEAGVYRIPIDQAMDLIVNEEYQQGNRTYSSEAPFVSEAPADTAQ